MPEYVPKIEPDGGLRGFLEIGAREFRVDQQLAKALAWRKMTFRG